MPRSGHTTIPTPTRRHSQAPIHGKVWITFTAGYKASGSNGKPAIEVKVTTDKSKIGFDRRSGHAYERAGGTDLRARQSGRAS